MPVEYVYSPEGTMHLRTQHPDTYKTLCEKIIRGKGWRNGDETMRGTCATCLPCRAARGAQETNARLGNYAAENGVDCCPCGCKYWANDRCIDCNEPWSSDLRDED